MLVENSDVKISLLTFSFEYDMNQARTKRRGDSFTKDMVAVS